MAAPHVESKIPVGTSLVGKYRVTREIGRGGMAAVYEAEHLSIGKKVAIKVLAAELAGSTIVIERFFREARAAASVRSPHIVDVYDSGRLEDGRPFIAMEMLDGESLYDRMGRARVLDVVTTAEVISQCAKGLTKAHAAGIVHRDLKPENIFLMKGDDGDLLVKILDFGLAKFYAPVDTDEKTARLTREGAVFGTPAYMSPEQVKGQGSVDHRADLWALGCMAYECLIGRPVWNTDQGVAMTFAAIAAAAPPVPSQVRTDLTPLFDEWFRKALERDPNKRFQSAKDLSDALTVALAVPVHPPQPSMHSSSGMRRGSQPTSPSGDIEWLETERPPPGETAMRLLNLPRPAGIPMSNISFADEGNAPDVVEPVPAPIPTVAPPPSRARALALGAGAAAVLAVIVVVVFINFVRPDTLSSSELASDADASASPAALRVPTDTVNPNDEPRWAASIAEGERLFSIGETDGAVRKWREPLEAAGHVVGASLIEQIHAASSGGRCKLVAVSHPRLDTAGAASRASIASSDKGVLVAWVDDHEQPGREHAYSVALDNSGHPRTRAHDITPESADVERPFLLALQDRFVLLYWDKSGHDAGVRVRWLDDDGRIRGASLMVGAARPGSYWPALEKTKDGFFVVWQDDRDHNGDDLFLRRLGSGLEPLGAEMRLTDYGAVGGHVSSVRTPALAYANNTLTIVYKLERGVGRYIKRMQLPLATAELSAVGLEDRAASGNPRDRLDRELGETLTLNSDETAPGDSPSIACGRDGCFVAWHDERGGASTAMLEPTSGSVIWTKRRFTVTGMHPSVAVNTSGEVALSYLDGGRVKISLLSRDGVGAAATVGKASTESAQLWLAGGRRPGEWHAVWQITESGHAEIIAGRIACH